MPYRHHESNENNHVKLARRGSSAVSGVTRQ